MRVFASITPWLPWLKPFLPSLVLLGGKASELYHGSLLGKSIPSLLVKDTIFGLERAGKKSQNIHDHLLRLGFQKGTEKTNKGKPSFLLYHREDLGSLCFMFPQIRSSQSSTSNGLLANPDKGLELLLENPHSVEVKYLDQIYEVRIPQVGRFVLNHGLKLRLKKKFDPKEIYQTAVQLIFILDLLAGNKELQDEALNDFFEIRPPALLREFRDNLKQNGPGSILWESAQKLYFNLYPTTKIVQLNSWYWEFQKEIAKVIELSKTDSSS